MTQLFDMKSKALAPGKYLCQYVREELTIGPASKRRYNRHYFEHLATGIVLVLAVPVDNTKPIGHWWVAEELEIGDYVYAVVQRERFIDTSIGNRIVGLEPR